MQALASPRWTFGRCRLTAIVEERTDRIPPQSFFPGATGDAVARHDWLVPDYADERGRISMSVQAFVVELPGRCVLVDPCVGNDKDSPLPFWHQRQWPFLERFHAAGFDASRVDTVVHTHLHADHVGWDTRLVDGRWVATFANARHLYTQRELDWCRAGGNPGIAGVYEQSVAPVIDAGLADIVDEDADLGDGLRLEPTPGHTPGHVSLWIESDGARALVSGDFLHHPVQCAEPQWAEIGDEDAELARSTRRRMLGDAERTRALFFGTHFANRPGGRIERRGEVWKFVAEEGEEGGERS